MSSMLRKVHVIWLGITLCAMLLMLSADSTAQATPVAAAPARGAVADVLAKKLDTAVIDLLTLHDGARGKDLELQIIYPRAGGPYPVIIFSHGAGGSRSTARPLVTFWASAGYVVICPTHAESVQLYLREHPGTRISAINNSGQQLKYRLLRDIATHPEDWENRAADISFILDSLGQIAEQTPQLHGLLDQTRIGVAGHSYGAYTTMLIGGAKVTPPGAISTETFADDRAQALLVLSGQGVGRLGLTESSWEAIHTPMMVMSGSADSAAGGMDIVSRRDPFDYAPAGDKYLVWIEGAMHSSFTGKLASSAPMDRLEARLLEVISASKPANSNPRNAADQVAIFDCVRVESLLFWDAYLKSDTSATARLKAADSTVLSGCEAAITWK